MNINAEKSAFGQTELKYLKFWINCKETHPLTQKVETIQKLQAPMTRKQPSKDISFKWTKIEQKAFDEMKKNISWEV